MQMKLFPDWQGDITLPSTPQRKEIVVGNTVVQQLLEVYVRVQLQN